MRYRYMVTTTEEYGTEDLEAVIASGSMSLSQTMIAVDALGAEGAPGPVTVHLTEAEARALLHAADVATGLSLTVRPGEDVSLAAGIRKLAAATPKPWTGPLE